MGPGGKILGPFFGILLFCLYKVTMHVASGLVGHIRGRRVKVAFYEFPVVPAEGQFLTCLQGRAL